MFSTFLFRNIARLVLFSYSVQLITPAYAGFADSPEEASRFRSGLKARVKAVDPFAEVASKKALPTLTIQTRQTETTGTWDLAVTQTLFDQKTSLFTTDYAWKETYSFASPSTIVRHPWEQYLKLQFSDGTLTAQTIPQTDQLNPYYFSYNYVFNTAATPNLTLLNLVTGGFVDVQNAGIVTTKHLEADAGIRLKSQLKICNTATEGKDKASILSKGEILLKTQFLDTQRGTIQGETILGFFKSKGSDSKSAMSLNTFNGAILANRTQIFSGGVLSNGKGKIGGRNLFDLYNEGVVFNTAGQLWGQGNTAIQTAALLNTDGAEVSGKNLTIRANQQLDTDKTSHLIADQKIKLRAGTVQQNSPFSAKTVEVHAEKDLTLGTPQFVENLFLSIENGPLIYPPDELQASNLLSITAKTPLTMTIPVKTPGALQVTAPEIMNKTTLVAKDELTLRGSSTTTPFPVRNTGTLGSNTKGITINGQGFSHETGTLDMAGNFDFKGENLKLFGQTTVGGDVHLKDRGKGEVDYSKLSVNGLFHLTLPENQTTLSHGFKIPGQLLLDRAGNSAQPLHILNNLMACKGVKIHLPNAELIFGAEADTQPMVKIQAKEGVINLKSKSLDIVKAQLYSKTGMDFEVKEKQIHIGRGIVTEKPMVFTYVNHLGISANRQGSLSIVCVKLRCLNYRCRLAAAPKNFSFVDCPNGINITIPYPFTQSNETLVVTDGPFRVISPQGILIDQAEVHALNWDITTEDPVRSEGGIINVAKSVSIHNSSGSSSSSLFQNIMLTKADSCLMDQTLTHPFSERGRINIGGDFHVGTLEDFAGLVYIVGKAPTTIKRTPFTPMLSGSLAKANPYIQEKFPSEASAKYIELEAKDLKLEGLTQAHHFVALIDGKLQIGVIANYQRPPTPPFQQWNMMGDGMGLSSLYKDKLNSNKPWIRRPVVPLNFKMDLPPAVVITPTGGLRLMDPREKFLFHFGEEIADLPRGFQAQVGRGCLDWENTNSLETFRLGRKQAYALYLKLYAPQGIQNDDTSSTLTIHNQCQNLSAVINRLSPEEQASLKFMRFYYPSEYEDREVYMPLSWISSAYDNPLARNPDGGIIADFVTLKRTSDASEVQNFATIFGKHLVDIDVGTIGNNRTSHRGVTYCVNATHRKGGWFSSDKDTYEIVAVPFSHTQSNTGIIATGPEGELNLTAEKFNNLNGAEVISGSGGQHLAIGTLNSTPAINTYPVSFQVEAKGYRATVHGVGAQIIPAAITSTGGIEWDVNNLNLTGTRVIEEAKDIDMVVGVGHLLPALQTVLANVTAEGGSKTTTVQTTHVQMASPTLIAALQGDVHLRARQSMDGIAPVIFGNKLYFRGKFDLPGMFLHNTVHTDSQTRSTFSSSHTVADQDVLNPLPTVIKAHTSITLTGEANLPGTHLKAPVIYDNTDDGLTMGPVIECAHQRQETHYSSPLAYGNAGSAGWREEQVAPRITAQKLIRTNLHGMMRFTNPELDVEDIQGHFETFVRHLLSHHEEWSHHTQVIPQEAMYVIAMAAAYFSGGTGLALGEALCGASTLGSIMIQAGFQTLCANVASSFARTGDPFQTMKDMVSKQSLFAIGESMATAGILHKIAPAMKVNMAPGQKGTLNNLKKFSLTNGVGAGVKTAMGAKPDRALGAALRQTAVQTVGATVAHEIGLNFKHPTLNLAGHGALGAGLAAALDEDPKSGAAGAILNEMLAMQFVDPQAIQDEVEAEGHAPEQRARVFEEKRQERFQYIRMLTAALVAFGGGKAATADFTGENALNHNFALTRCASPFLPRIGELPEEDNEEDDLVLNPILKKQQKERADFIELVQVMMAEEEGTGCVPSKKPSFNELSLKEKAQHLWNLFYEESKECLRIRANESREYFHSRANESREYFHAQANRDYLQELACLPIPGSGMAAFAYEGRNIYRGTQTLGGAAVDMVIGVVAGKTVIWTVKKVIMGGKYVWQKSKTFVQTNLTNTLSAFVHNEQGAGKGLGKTAAFFKERPLLAEDIAKHTENLVVRGTMRGDGEKIFVKLDWVKNTSMPAADVMANLDRNNWRLNKPQKPLSTDFVATMMNQLTSMATKRGATTLQIETMVINHRLSVIFSKRYNAINRSGDSLTRYVQDLLITIPLSSGKVPQSVNLKSWKEVARDIYKEDLGNNIGGVEYFSAELSMKSRDVVNIFVQGIEGKGVKLRNLRDDLVRLGKETGANVLEITAQFDYGIPGASKSIKLKNHLVKHHNWIPTDRPKILGDLNPEIYPELNNNNWYKTTIPLTSGKVPQPLNLKGEANVTGKISSFIHDEKGAGKDILAGVLALGKKATEGGKYVWDSAKSILPRRSVTRPPHQVAKHSNFIGITKDPTRGFWQSDEFNSSGILHLYAPERDMGMSFWGTWFNPKVSYVVNAHGGRKSVALDTKVIVPFSEKQSCTEILKRFSPFKQPRPFGARSFPIEPLQKFEIVEKTYILTSRQLAMLVKKQEGYKKGQSVTLYSCSTGKIKNGIAQHLANKLGAPVQAPTGSIWVSWQSGDPTIIQRVPFLKYALAKSFIPEETKWGSSLARHLFGEFRTFYPGEYHPPLIDIPENLLAGGAALIGGVLTGYILREWIANTQEEEPITNIRLNAHGYLAADHEENHPTNTLAPTKKNSGSRS